MDVEGIEFVQVMHKLHKDAKLSPAQDRFMSSERPAEELYDINEDPYELNNLAANPEYGDVLSDYAAILEKWIKETDDKGQYPENVEGLKFMLGIWGENCINPEYGPIKKKYPNLAGSLFYLKSEPSKLIDSSPEEDPMFDMDLLRE